MLNRVTTGIGRGGWTGRLVLIAVVLIAYYLGTLRPTVSVHTSVPSSAEGAISATTDGWSYSIPLDGVVWIDSTGSFHDSDRPACLPASGTDVPVTFGSLDVSYQGLNWRAVVLVDCR
jgi:hypothetical protein